MKRVLSLGLVLTMLCALLTFMPAAAATIVNSGTFGANDNNLTWALDDKGVLTISGVGSMGITSEDSEIPRRDVQRSISSVIIEYGVTDVGFNAFDSWSDTLTNVSLYNKRESSISCGYFRKPKSFYRSKRIYNYISPVALYSQGDYATS